MIGFPLTYIISKLLLDIAFAVLIAGVAKPSRERRVEGEEFAILALISYDFSWCVPHCQPCDGLWKDQVGSTVSVVIATICNQMVYNATGRCGLEEFAKF